MIYVVEDAIKMLLQEGASREVAIEPDIYPEVEKRLQELNIGFSVYHDIKNGMRWSINGWVPSMHVFRTTVVKE